MCDEEALDHLHIDFEGEVEHSRRFPCFVKGKEVVETGVESAVFGCVGECGSNRANMLGQEFIVDGWARFEGFDGSDIRGVGRDGLIRDGCAIEQELDGGCLVIGIEEVVGWEISNGGDRAVIQEAGAGGRHAPNG